MPWKCALDENITCLAWHVSRTPREPPAWYCTHDPIWCDRDCGSEHVCLPACTYWIHAACKPQDAPTTYVNTMFSSPTPDISRAELT